MNITPGIFNFQQHQLRGLLIDQQPWVVAKDLCDTLGLTNSRDVVRRTLDDDEWTVYEIHTPSRGTVRMQVVNESGAWALVLKSRKPEAKAVRKWLTNEVLPAIRRTGSYQRPGAAPKPARPAAPPKALPKAERARQYWDASHLPYDRIAFMQGEVRVVVLRGRNWYSVQDALLAMGTRWRQPQLAIAKIPADHRHLIKVFGVSTAGWYVDDTALRMLLAARGHRIGQLTLGLA